MKLVKKEVTQEADFLPNALRIATIADEVKAILNHVKEGMKAIGVAPLHVEGAVSGAWLILDYGDIIFHIFRKEARIYYDLDALWGDAPQIDLGLEGVS